MAGRAEWLAASRHCAGTNTKGAGVCSHPAGVLAGGWLSGCVRASAAGQQLHRDSCTLGGAEGQSNKPTWPAGQREPGHAQRPPSCCSYGPALPHRPARPPRPPRPPRRRAGSSTRAASACPLATASTPSPPRATATSSTARRARSRSCASCTRVGWGGHLCSWIHALEHKKSGIDWSTGEGGGELGAGALGSWNGGVGALLLLCQSAGAGMASSKWSKCGDRG